MIINLTERQSNRGIFGRVLCIDRDVSRQVCDDVRLVDVDDVDGETLDVDDGRIAGCQADHVLRCRLEIQRTVQLYPVCMKRFMRRMD